MAFDRCLILALTRPGGDKGNIIMQCLLLDQLGERGFVAAIFLHHLPHIVGL